MNGPLLVINSGSSSLKFGVYAHREGHEAVLFKGTVRHIGGERGTLSLQDAHGQKVFEKSAPYPTQREAFDRAMDRLESLGHTSPVAIGHRVVHGGPHLREHRALTGEVLHTLETTTHFAPLHVPPALELIHHARERYPSVPQFACFDTVFHRTLPEEAAVFPVPRQYRDQGVERYGFHGLSYESIVERLKPRVPERTVVAHLGSGASLVALRHGISVDTTMGFTPTGGIPMGTRTGDIDPGVLLWLLRQGHVDAEGLESLVNHDSGLKALSGGTSDMSELTRAAGFGDASAALALSVFVRSIAKTIGAYAAVLGGIDLLVFTGGIGENSPIVRQRVCAMLGHLGLVLDDARNRDGQGVISAPGSRGTIQLLPSEEEEQIARHTRRLMRA
ncbi:acetate kinase [Cystobacter fuscus]|uniref:Acetate kinase n=1 Tax=Cystobacter fuscus TaxID=43 RepID=A0A250JAN8_9BACT|nr:acetate/propionate family kinase [Cystobacter fuscus]ATB40643.1 acetate kinase [Cystobacter fuscus]